MSRRISEVMRECTSLVGRIESVIEDIYKVKRPDDVL